jgi:hypothetical protein
LKHPIFALQVAVDKITMIFHGGTGNEQANVEILCFRLNCINCCRVAKVSLDGSRTV